MTALVGARILTPGGWVDGHAVLIAKGRITAVVGVADVPDDCAVTYLAGGVLLPGFIDTQVNGGGGVLFNDVPTVDGIAAIAAAHRAYGTTALLPTLISDDLAVIARAIAAVDDAIVAGVPGVIGIHIEGPFLNPEKRGIHDAAKFRTIDANAIDLLASLKHGRTLVTLAPELAAPGMIAALVDRGVIVAAGHTQARYDDMRRAIDEGLSGVTHLFNAVPPLVAREPGVIGAAFDARLYAGLIADGHHVHAANLRLALRLLGPERAMLVTDAMPTVGSGAPSFRLGAVDIVASDGALRSADGTLAGSNLDMASAVRGATVMMAASLADASAMASVAPARFLGLGDDYGVVAAGARADLVALDNDLAVTDVWVDDVHWKAGLARR